MKVEVITSNNASIDVVVATSQPMVPSTAIPLDIGLVEISSVDQYIPGPQGPPGPKGDTGPQGEQGADGYVGADGPPNILNIGTVTTVAPGGAATASITGTSPAQTLNLGIPSGLTGATGATGSTGAQGPAGPANTLTIGSVTTVPPPNGTATATITGTSPNQTLNLGIPAGNTGTTGSQGPAGQGVPIGGTANQVLAKINATDYNTQWVTPASGTVTAVTGTAPVVSSGGTTPAISMAAATTSIPGYLTSADWNTFNGKAPLASPTFTGTPAAPTATAGTNTTQIATTAFVTGNFVELAGDTMTGPLTTTALTTTGSATIGGQLVATNSAGHILNGSTLILRSMAGATGNISPILSLQDKNSTQQGYVQYSDTNTRTEFYSSSSGALFAGNGGTVTLQNFGTGPLNIGASSGAMTLNCGSSNMAFTGGGGTWTLGGGVGMLYNTTNPTAVCAIKASFAGAGTQYGLVLYSGSTAASNQVQFYNGTAPGTLVGSITTNASATAFNTSSDERLKDFIGPYDPQKAIDIIRADPVRDFNWTDGSGYAVGWGAQTSYAISPDLASPPIDDSREPGDEGFQPWGMDQSKRTPYLWAAVSGLLARIEALEARVAELEAV